MQTSSTSFINLAKKKIKKKKKQTLIHIVNHNWHYLQTHTLNNKDKRNYERLNKSKIYNQATRYIR